MILFTNPFGCNLKSILALGSHLTCHIMSALDFTLLSHVLFYSLRLLLYSIIMNSLYLILSRPCDITLFSLNKVYG